MLGCSRSAVSGRRRSWGTEPAPVTERLLRPDGETLAYRRLAGAGPTVVWLGGFNSDMSGTKA